MDKEPHQHTIEVARVLQKHWQKKLMFWLYECTPYDIHLALRNSGIWGKYTIKRWVEDKRDYQTYWIDNQDIVISNWLLAWFQQFKLVEKPVSRWSEWHPRWWKEKIVKDEYGAYIIV